MHGTYKDSVQKADGIYEAAVSLSIHIIARTLLFTYSHMYSSQTGMTRTVHALEHIFLIYTLKYFTRNLLGAVIKIISMF